MQNANVIMTDTIPVINAKITMKLETGACLYSKKLSKNSIGFSSKKIPATHMLIISMKKDCHIFTTYGLPLVHTYSMSKQNTTT